MILLFLGLVLLALFLWNHRFCRQWEENLLIRVRFGRPHVYEGETAELIETIENRKKMPVPVLEIGFRVPKGIRYLDAENTQISDYNYKRDLFSVHGMEQITRRYRILGARRGRYTVSGITCKAPDLLFRRLMMREAQGSSAGGVAEGGLEGQDEGEEFVVYCRRLECSVILRSVEVLLGQRQSARRVYEDPFAFSSIREYTIRDPQRTINWKASAKTGKLMVNTCTSVLSDQVLLFMDASQGGQRYGEVLLEGVLSLTATLCERLLRQRQTVGLVTSRMNDGRPVIFPSGTGERKLAELEYFFTGEFHEENTVPLVELLQGGTIPDFRELSGTDGAVCIFITMHDSDEVRAAIRNYLGRGAPGILAVVCRGEETEKAENVQGLQVVRVKVD